MSLEIHPVTPGRWDDLVALFGPSGAFGGCWCMFPILSSKDFQANGNAGNQAAMAALVAAGPPPGLLAYDGGEPVGWVAVGPREGYGRIQRSWVTKPVDDVPVWSVVCFVIARRRRGEGIAAALLGAAADYASEHGATALEGYAKDGRTADEFAWMGPMSLFANAGFTEIARRSPTRPVMRLEL